MCGCTGCERRTMSWVYDPDTQDFVDDSDNQETEFTRP
jgi:hypothetical protein